MRFGTAKPAMVIGIVALLGISLRASATEFAAAKSYPVGTNPSGVVVADFNGDGKPDIAVVNSGSNNVSILLGNGDGTFQAAKNFDAGNSMNAIFAADFNGDGKQDLALFLPGSSTNSTNGEVRILLGNGDGTFQAAVATTLTVAATILSVGDFNGDKKADLVLSSVDPNTESVTVEVLLGKGDGTFQSAKQIPASDLNAPAFTVGDFNNDGELDLAVAISGGVQVLLGKGDGTFQSGGTANLAMGFAPKAILAVDLNGDGRLDLIVDSQQTSGSGILRSTRQRVSVFLADGSGTFQSEILILTAIRGVDFGGLASDLLVGDFNGDGKNDLGDVEGTLEVRLAKGDEAFSTAIPFAGVGAQAAVADLNGDKFADLIAVDSAGNQVVVLLNDSPTSGADLGFTAASGSPATAGVGNNLTYTADVIDEGPEDSTNVQFTDTLPAGVTVVSATSSQGICSKSQSVVTCGVGSLRVAQDATITIVVTPTVAQMITNSMSLSGSEPDLALANNSATQTSTVLPTYTLTVGKSGSGSGRVTGDATPSNGANGEINCGSTCSANFLRGTQVFLDVAGADVGDFFISWGGACAGNGFSCTVTMSGDETVTANFAKGNILSVTLAGSGGGIVEDQGASFFVCTSTNGDCSPSLLPGSTIAIQAIPSGNSTFGGWSGACSGTDPNNCTITMSSNQNVTATFNPPPDFSLSPASASLTAVAGSQVTDVISISEQGGFSNAIQLACAVAGPAPLPACALSPNSIPAGANSPSSKLTFSAGTLATSFPASLARNENAFACLLPFGLLGCMLGPRFSKRQRKMLAFCFTILFVAMVQAACGGGSSAPAPPASQNYVVTVTASSGAIQHSTTISITVK
jgi:uncharacterized repeat protein (TIGR01451 family)